MCAKCQQEKPYSDFYKGKKYKDGYQSWCKQCKRDRKRELGTDKQYFEKNREYVRKVQREYYKKNKERIIKRVKEYQGQHVVAVKGYKQKYADNNKDKKAAYRKLYRSTAKGKLRNTQYTLRRKREISRTPENIRLTIKQWEFILSLFDNKCACCFAETKLTIDHIMPISKGGLDIITNVQPLCPSCNSKKHAKYIDYRPAEFIHLLYV